MAACFSHSSDQTSREDSSAGAVIWVLLARLHLDAPNQGHAPSAFHRWILPPIKCRIAQTSWRSCTCAGGTPQCSPSRGWINAPWLLWRMQDQWGFCVHPQGLKLQSWMWLLRQWGLSQVDPLPSARWQTTTSAKSAVRRHTWPTFGRACPIYSWPSWPPFSGHRWTAPFGTSVTSSCWHFPTRHRNWASLWQSLCILVNMSGWCSCPSQRWCTGSFDCCLQSQANRSDQSHWQPWTAPLGLMSSDGDWQPSIGGHLLPIVGQVNLGWPAAGPLQSLPTPGARRESW